MRPDSGTTGQNWPKFPYTSNALTGVSCTSTTSCMAVGTAGDGVHVIAEQWNGGSWTAQALDPSSPTPDNEFVDVFAVSCWNPSQRTAQQSAPASRTHS
jgi:hypothetical protein